MDLAWDEMERFDGMEVILDEMEMILDEMDIRRRY